MSVCCHLISINKSFNIISHHQLYGLILYFQRLCIRYSDELLHTNSISSLESYIILSPPSNNMYVFIISHHISCHLCEDIISYPLWHGSVCSRFSQIDMLTTLNRERLIDNGLRIPELSLGVATDEDTSSSLQSIDPVIPCTW